MFALISRSGAGSVRRVPGLFLTLAFFLSSVSVPAAVGIGCSPAFEPDLAEQSCSILNGRLDDNPAHGGVVALHFKHTLCSGTLIAPWVVLTAGHCAQDVSPEDYTVLFGLHTSVPGTAIERGVVDVVVHPFFDPGEGLQPLTNDLALLLLDESPPPGAPPIPHLPSFLGLDDQDIGRPLEFVGYGRTEHDETGDRMTVTSDLMWICTSPGGCNIGPTRASENTICQNQQPGGPCSGDSGGPALLFRGGTEYVVGVTSYGLEDCYSFGCSTKVDEFDVWISEYLKGKSGSDCALGATCDSGICVNGVCCTSDCDGLCNRCDLPGTVGLCRPVIDDTPCSDGDPCNGDEVCRAGACIFGQQLQCDDSEPCTVDSCQPDVGCINAPTEDGSPCPDDNVCDGAALCVRGQCTEGPPPECDDSDPCTVDACDPEVGCTHTPGNEGSSCDYGLCGPAVCESGQCRFVDPPECDDGDPCTLDFCASMFGCMVEEMADGTPCGSCKSCQAGECTRQPNCDPAGCGCGSRGMGRAGPGWLMWGLGWLALWCRRRGSRGTGAGKESRA